MRYILLADISVLDWAIKILGAAGGIIGTVLGIYNFRHARRKERSERESEENDWQMLLEFRAQMKKTGGNALTPAEGSDLHRWAERMVKKGLLERGLGGVYYTLPRGD
jgi:hypothetical protein